MDEKINVNMKNSQSHLGPVKLEITLGTEMKMPCRSWMKEDRLQ